MHLLSSSIRYIRLRRAHKKQKRIALHMLAVSGVVRPSHIELRYEAPIVNMMSVSHGHAALSGQPLTHPLRCRHGTTTSRSLDVNQTLGSKPPWL